MENLIIDFIENLSEMEKIELYNNYCDLYDCWYEARVIIGIDDLEYFCDYDNDLLLKYTSKNEYFNKFDKYFYYIGGIIESTNNYENIFKDDILINWLNATIKEKNTKIDLIWCSQPLKDKIKKTFEKFL